MRGPGNVNEAELASSPLIICMQCFIYRVVFDMRGVHTKLSRGCGHEPFCPIFFLVQEFMLRLCAPRHKACMDVHHVSQRISLGSLSWGEAKLPPCPPVR